jgi:hypothetical protein
MLQKGLHITSLESWDELDSVLSTVTANFGNNFADKRRSLGRYTSLEDWGHGVFKF